MFTFDLLAFVCICVPARFVSFFLTTLPSITMESNGFGTFSMFRLNVPYRQKIGTLSIASFSLSEGSRDEPTQQQHRRRRCCCCRYLTHSQSTNHLSEQSACARSVLLLFARQSVRSDCSCICRAKHRVLYGLTNQLLSKICFKQSNFELDPARSFIFDVYWIAYRTTNVNVHPNFIEKFKWCFCKFQLNFKNLISNFQRIFPTVCFFRIVQNVINMNERKINSLVAKGFRFPNYLKSAFPTVFVEKKF